MLSPLFVTSSIQLLWFKENTNSLRRHKYYTNIKYKKYPTTIALTTGFIFTDRDQITDHQVLICSDDVKMSLQSCFLEMLPLPRQLVVTMAAPPRAGTVAGLTVLLSLPHSVVVSRMCRPVSSVLHLCILRLYITGGCWICGSQLSRSSHQCLLFKGQRSRATAQTTFI